MVGTTEQRPIIAQQGKIKSFVRSASPHVHILIFVRKKFFLAGNGFGSYRNLTSKKKKKKKSTTTNQEHASALCYPPYPTKSTIPNTFFFFFFSKLFFNPPSAPLFFFKEKRLGERRFGQKRIQKKKKGRGDEHLHLLFVVPTFNTQTPPLSPGLDFKLHPGGLFL